MKVLIYVNSFDQDYLEGMIYGGFVKLFGVDNVVEYPYKTWFHCRTRQDFYIPQTSGHRHPKSCFLDPKERHRHSFEEVLDLVRHDYFDVVIINSRLLPQNRETSHLIAEESVSRGTPTVAFQGGDGTKCVDWWAVERSRQNVNVHAFMRDFLQEFASLSPRFHPLPLAFNLDHAPKTDGSKVRDIIWVGYLERSPTRRVVASILGSTPYSKLIRGTYDLHQIDYFEYLEMIAQSRVGVSIDGSQSDSDLRYFEVPGCRTMLLALQPRIVIPNNFVDRESAVFYHRENLSEVVRLLDYYLKHGEEREEIARRGYEHLCRFHAIERRAEYMLEKTGLK